MINSIKFTTLVALTISASAGIADEYRTADCGLTSGYGHHQRSNGQVGLYRPSYNSSAYGPNAYHSARPNRYDRNSAHYNFNNSYQRTGYGQAYAPRDVSYGQRTSPAAYLNHNRGYAQPTYRPTSTLGSLFGLFNGTGHAGYYGRGITMNSGYSHGRHSNPAGYYGR